MTNQKTPTIRTYNVLVARPEHSTEEIRQYDATSYGEALTMAERANAGIADALYGIPAADFDLAGAEGIAFNEADGLLL